MMNLSSSYFTNQHHDLAQIHRLVPEVPLYLEMTHTTMTGKALSGSGTQPYLRTVDDQFYTTAHLARQQGATQAINDNERPSAVKSKYGAYTRTNR